MSKQEPIPSPYYPQVDIETFKAIEAIASLAGYTEFLFIGVKDSLKGNDTSEVCATANAVSDVLVNAQIHVVEEMRKELERLEDKKK